MRCTECRGKGKHGDSICPSCRGTGVEPVTEVTLKRTAQELKQHFLEAASPLVDDYVGAALGTKKIQSTNASAREQVWDLLCTLMKQSSEKIDIDIESADDVIKAVTDGKCTMEEGKKLLELYKKAKEITYDPAMSKEGGLTINIHGASPIKDIKEPIEVLANES